MSVPGKFKPEIADCCFCSHCFYLLALLGKLPVVVISCHKNTVNILITKTFISYFAFAAKTYFRYGVMSYQEQSKQFHLCIGQYSNDRINFAFPTFQRRQLFRGWVPLATSLVVPHLLYHFRQLFCRYFFGIFDLRGFCFVCHISKHLNN